MDATFAQRRAVFNMFTALGWDVRGVHSMTKEQASEAIEKAREVMKTCPCGERGHRVEVELKKKAVK